MTDVPAGSDALSMDAVDAEMSAARRFAALSGPFDPVEAMGMLGVDPATLGADKLTLISAGLAAVCDLTEVDGRQRWLMRGSERRRELERLAQGGERATTVDRAVAWRQQATTDPATDDLLAAITGKGRFSTKALQDLVTGRGDKEELERVAQALERAGSLSPRHPYLPEVRAALTRAGLQANLQSLLDRGFFGREEELARTRAWAQAAPAAQTRALYVQGLPGIGKSTLLDETAASLLKESTEWIVVRLDFDRAGLDVQDFQGLTVELARQVAAQLESSPAELLRARESVVSGRSLDTRLKGGSRQFVPPQLGKALAAALARERRHLLVLLDTLEVLRGRGETQPARLFEWLDQLAGFGEIRMAVIGAGRGDALGSAPEKMADDPVNLDGLDDASADRLLASLGVEPQHFEQVRAVTDKNPLALRLAAKVAVEEGAEALADATGRDGYNAAYIYRFLLSRIEDEDLRQLANPGLVVRVINPEVIREVLAPAVGLQDLTAQRAQTLFEELASHHWLVQPDPIAAGFVRHRADMRAVLLPILYADSPAECAAIDRQAARWFARRTEPWAALEVSYHRLQLMRRDKRVPTLDPGTLGQLDELTIRELPPVAQDLVLRSRGERTTSYRGGPGSGGSSLDPHAVQELRSIIDRGDWVEGGYYYDRAFRDAVFDARSDEADTARAYLWRSGQWSEVRRLLRARDDAGADDSDLQALAERFPQGVACRLEMRAEFQFDELVRWLREDEARAGMASYVVSQGLRSSLGSGALRLALEAVGDHHRALPSELDPAGAAALWWKGEPAPATTVDQPCLEEDAGWRRITTRIGPDHPPDPGPAGRARALAALSPYAELVATMTATGDRERVLAFLDRAHRRMDDLGLLAPGRDGAWHDVAPSEFGSSGLHSLTDVGLLAEAIGAASYVLGDTDLALVTRSAERWRRTMAGTWSYGRVAASRPRGWDQPIDASLADRIDTLGSARDPVRRCEEQLAAWCDPQPGGGTVIDLVRRRAPALVAKAADAGDAHQAARVLLGRFVPSAFVPGLTVLLTHSPSPHRKRQSRTKEPQ
jgi:hypothetical protein